MLYVNLLPVATVGNTRGIDGRSSDSALNREIVVVVF